MPELFGHYELLEKIGEGGMAEVFKARHTGVAGFEKILVVKKILPMHARNRAFVDMLVHEAKICSLLQHPNIVPTFDLGEIEGVYYLTMEYVAGIDLLRLLQRAARASTRIPIPIALFVTGEVAKGLAYAHSAVDRDGRPLNVIHRDVSPANIMIGWRGEVKLMDFGVARADLEVDRRRGSSLVRQDGLKGKLSYMSPELVSGHEIDHRSDIFALGTLMFEMLTLKRLFMGKSEVQTMANVRKARITRRIQRHDHIPEGVQEMIRRALAREPHERYQTALELDEAIQDYLFEQRERVNSATLARFVADLFPDLRPAPGPTPAKAKRRDQPDRDTVRDLRRPAAAAPAAGAPLAPLAPLRRPRPAARPPEHAPTTRQPRASLAALEASVRPKGDDDTVEEEGLADGGAGAGEDPVVGLIGALNMANGRSRETPAPSEEAAAPAGAPPDQDATYRLRSGPDGDTFGPISLENLRRLLRSRSVSEREEVSVDGGSWVPIARSDLAQLDPALLGEGKQPVYTGPLERAWLPRLFLSLHATQARGMLALTHDWARKELYFEDGLVVHVHSNLKEELLATSMTIEGAVRDEDVLEALEYACEHGVQLGEALVAKGRLTETALRHLLKHQQERRFLELFGWSAGRFAFFAGARVPDYARGDGLDVCGLVARGVRVGYGRSELRAFFAGLEGHRVMPRGEDGVRPSRLLLEPAESEAMKLLRDGPTVAEGAAAAPDEDAYWRLLFLVLQADLATLEA